MFSNFLPTSFIHRPILSQSFPSIRGFAVLVAAMLASLAATAQAHETGYGSGDSCYPNCETIEIPIKVSDPSVVHLRFYSSDRDWSWPGGSRYWVINDYNTNTYALQCRYGEQVCYGAWKSSGSGTWGVGKSRLNSCQDCCYTCDSKSVNGWNLQ